MTALPLTLLVAVLISAQPDGGNVSEPPVASPSFQDEPDEPGDGPISSGTPRSSPNSEEESPESDESSLDPDEIRERRYMRSERLLDRILSAPQYLLDLPWYPIKKFLNFSERVDLVKRAQDFFYFNEEKTAGWAPEVALGGELGDGLGASVYHHDIFNREHSADASFLFASGEEYSWRAAYAIPRTENYPFTSRLAIGMVRDEEVEIFVIRDALGRPVLGMDTDDDDDPDYEFRTIHGRLDLAWEFQGLPGFRIAPHIRGEISKADPSGAVATAALAGLDGLGEEIGLIASGLTLTLDRRDNPLRPSRGFFLQSAVEASLAPDKTSAGNRFGHTDYSLLASIFVPLHGLHRVLVVSQTLRRVDPWGGNELAFYHQPILDLVHGLRSFERYRFRDRGALLTNIEYRYPIWRTWDAYIFGDGGQTFHQYSDIDTDDFEFSVGGGIRFMTQDSFLLMTQIGYGSEGTEVYFSVGQVF